MTHKTTACGRRNAGTTACLWMVRSSPVVLVAISSDEVVVHFTTPATPPTAKPTAKPTKEPTTKPTTKTIAKPTASSR